MNSIALVAIATDISRGVGELKAAIDKLKTFCTVEAASSIYKRNSGFLLKDSRAELIIVIKIKTSKDVQTLNSALESIKAKQKKCEIVLLTYNHDVQILPHLTLPNPILAQDAAVLGCASEVYADFLHPIIGKNLGEIIQTMGYLENIEFHSQGNILGER